MLVNAAEAGTVRGARFPGRYIQGAGVIARLGHIGITEVTREKLAVVAQRACRAGEIIHNEPMQVTEEMVIEALEALETLA